VGFGAGAFKRVVHVRGKSCSRRGPVPKDQPQLCKAKHNQGGHSRRHDSNPIDLWFDDGVPPPPPRVDQVKVYDMDVDMQVVRWEVTASTC
jgi:hypothetical protein